MDEPAAKRKPVTRSYLAPFATLALSSTIFGRSTQKHNVQKVPLIHWSWGARTAAFYASLHSENAPTERGIRRHPRGLELLGIEGTCFRRDWRWCNFCRACRAGSK
jgi:hypothetical protein